MLQNQMKNDLYLSVILPVYNEEKKILKDLEEILSYFKNKNYRYEIIVVDDGSRDNTKKILFEFKDKCKELRILSYHPNRGKGFAVKTGILNAKGKYILFADAGSCVSYDNMEKGIELLKNGYDCAFGSRALKDSQILVHQPRYRQVGSKIFSLIVKFIMGIREVEDTQCGFKLFKREVAKSIFRLNKIDGFMFDIETILNGKKNSYQMKEFPIEWSNDPDTRFNPIKGTIQNFKELIRIKLGI